MKYEDAGISTEKMQFVQRCLKTSLIMRKEVMLSQTHQSMSHLIIQCEHESFECVFVTYKWNIRVTSCRKVKLIMVRKGVSLFISWFLPISTNHNLIVDICPVSGHYHQKLLTILILITIAQWETISFSLLGFFFLELWMFQYIWRL